MIPIFFRRTCPSVFLVLFLFLASAISPYLFKHTQHQMRQRGRKSEQFKQRNTQDATARLDRWESFKGSLVPFCNFFIGTVPPPSRILRAPTTVWLGQEALLLKREELMMGN